MASDVERFITYLHSERGLADHTVTSYRFDLCSFEKFLDGIPLRTADRGSIRAFLARELSAERNARSVARKLSAVRHFYRFLLDEEVISANPAEHIPVPKTWKTAPKSISAAEVQMMVDDLDSTSAIGLRDRAMLLTCFAAGLRVSELVSLRLDSLDLEHSFLTVRLGKGSKDRIAPLNPVAITALPGAGSAHHRENHLSALAATFFRHNPDRRRRRSARGADHARACVNRHNADLPRCGPARLAPGLLHGTPARSEAPCRRELSSSSSHSKPVI